MTHLKSSRNLKLVGYSPAYNLSSNLTPKRRFLEGYSFKKIACSPSITEFSELVLNLKGEPKKKPGYDSFSFVKIRNYFFPLELSLDIQKTSSYIYKIFGIVNSNQFARKRNSS